MTSSLSTIWSKTKAWATKPATYITFASALCTTPLAFAGNLYFDLSNNVFAAKYAAEQKMNPVNYSGGLMLTEDNGSLYNLGMYTSGKMKNTENIYGGLGGRFYYVNAKSFDDFQALAFGGFINIGLPFPNFSVDVELYIAPSITTFKVADGFTDLNFKVNYEMFENAKLYIGLRDTEIHFEDSRDYTFADGLYLGMMIDI